MLSTLQECATEPEYIASVVVHPVKQQEVVNKVMEWISNNVRPSAYIMQANANTVVEAAHDPKVQRAVYYSTLSVPDCMPLVWLLRLKGHRNVERVYGPDLMLMLCEQGAKVGWRCFLYGGKVGVAEELKEVLVTRFPGLDVVGTSSPPFRSLTAQEELEVCNMINASKPDILWVGLGSPKQDIWMHEHRNKLDVSVMHGVGAAFDFLSGRVPQAPRWMMNSGLEWLFRLMVEPRRLWKRYTVVNLKFLYLVARELFGRPDRDESQSRRQI